MAITTAQKADIVKQYARGEADTGSPEVQVALLTATHQRSDRPLKSNAKTITVVGLLRMVSQRRSLLNYRKTTIWIAIAL